MLLKKSNNVKQLMKKRIILAILPVFILSVLYIGYSYFSIYKQTKESVQNVKKEVDVIKNEVQNQDFAKITDSLNNVQKQIDNTRDNLASIKVVSILPQTKKEFKAVTTVLDTFSAVIGSVGEIVKIGEELSIDINSTNKPLKDLDFSKLSSDQKGNVIVAIRKTIPMIEEIKNGIAGLEDEVLVLENSPWSKYVDPKILEQAKNVVGFGDMFDLIIAMMNDISTLIGENKPANYLILLQNNTELRPTGGFIGTYGILRVDQGKAELKFDDVYNLDKTVKETMFIDPPWQLTEWNDTAQWFLRDANWSPDFITSATQAQTFYNLESGEDLDFAGVVAFTPDVIADIIGLFGKINIDGLVFTKDNFVEMLEYEVEMKFKELGISLDKRKEVIKKIYDQINIKLKTLSIDQYIELAKIVNDNLNQKHILMFFNDKDLEDTVVQKNWSGHIRGHESDYLMVIDANLGSLKTDAVMDKRISYEVEYFQEKLDPTEPVVEEVDIDHKHDAEGNDTVKNIENKEIDDLGEPTEEKSDIKNHLVGRVTVSYTNNGKFTWHSTRYRTFTRVYAPLGSRLMNTDGAMVTDRNKEKGEVDIVDELGKTSFGAFIAIEPGETKKLFFEYELPTSVADQYSKGEYSLSIQKQPGTKGHLLNVKIGEKEIETDLVVDRFIN